MRTKGRGVRMETKALDRRHGRAKGDGRWGNRRDRGDRVNLLSAGVGSVWFMLTVAWSCSVPEAVGVTTNGETGSRPRGTRIPEGEGRTREGPVDSTSGRDESHVRRQCVGQGHAGGTRRAIVCHREGVGHVAPQSHQAGGVSREHRSGAVGGTVSTAWPILLPSSVNQMLPSGPAVIPAGLPLLVGMGKSTMAWVAGLI